MSLEKKYIYRIIVGYIIFLLNSEYTWNILRYFINYNVVRADLITKTVLLMMIISLIGQIIVVINAIFLFKLTLKK